MTKRRLLIASGNHHKTREIAAIVSAGLKEIPFEIATLADFAEVAEPEETGADYAENAAIKATSGAARTGLLSLGDDVGLEIDLLDGQPGLYSKRFAGEHTPFPEKIRLILEKLDGLPTERRAARFRAAVAVAVPDGQVHTFEAVREGHIAFAPKGGGGFGYDPIFFLPEFGCTLAELAPDEKNRTSHRALVLAKAMPLLRQLLTA